MSSSDDSPPARRHHLPKDIAPPFGRYVHGVSLPADARFLVTSGQLALGPDGELPEGAEAQAALCFENIRAILSDAGMAPRDIVKITAFVTDRVYMQDYMRARDIFLRDVDPPPASTLVIVSGFTRPEFLVEIEVLAARNDPPGSG